jgi:TetR/AcrR family transcriptional regulator, transcriptional repressor for nem operon
MPDIKHFDPAAVLDAAERLFWQHGVASTGIQDIVTATGINRSSLYATFGGKRELYLAALRRYVEHQSEPGFARLAGDTRGLPAISEFFDRLIQVRCTGQLAQWGCMISNAHAGPDSDDPDVRHILQQHHQRLRSALRAALRVAAGRGQLRPDLDPEVAADLLAMLAYAVNLRSRAGADAPALRATITGTLSSMADPGPGLMRTVTASADADQHTRPAGASNGHGRRR